MFERYTQKARRVIFFARYECSALGSSAIGCEHLLLGLLRESKETVAAHLRVDVAELEARLRSSSTDVQTVATSVDVPLDESGKRALAYAAEEAMRMGHTHIGTEHLLLGVLREEQGTAAEALRALGAPGLPAVRLSVAESAAKGEVRTGRGPIISGPVPSVRVVEEESGRELLADLPLGIVPRIGEAVLLGDSQKDEPVLYRVVDVRWRLRGGPHRDPSIIVDVLVRRERSNED